MVEIRFIAIEQCLRVLLLRNSSGFIVVLYCEWFALLILSYLWPCQKRPQPVIIVYFFVSRLLG